MEQGEAVCSLNIFPLTTMGAVTLLAPPSHLQEKRRAGEEGGWCEEGGFMFMFMSCSMSQEQEEEEEEVEGEDPPEKPWRCPPSWPL